MQYAEDKTSFFDAQELPLRCFFWGHKNALARCGGETMEYGIMPSPLGPLLAAWNSVGLCHLCFAPQGRPVQDELRPLWPGSAWQENTAQALALARRIFAPKASAATPPLPSGEPLRLLLRGAPFQLEVWRALLGIPAGQTVSYGELARMAGRPGAARAAGTAMAQNPIVYLVPCHRVVRSGGNIGHYGGGSDLKARMLAWEAGVSAEI